MKNVITMATIGLMAFAIAGTHLHTNAQDVQATGQKEAAARPKALPFHGKLKEIDREQKTVVVGSRTFQLTDTTKVLPGSVESVDDAKIGDKVGGSYTKDQDGSLTVQSIRFGEKPGKTTQQGDDK